MSTFSIEKWRSIARSITPGGLRDAAVDAVNAIDAALAGLCSWEDTEQHPSFRVLSCCSSAYPPISSREDDRLKIKNLHVVLYGLAWRKSQGDRSLRA